MRPDLEAALKQIAWTHGWTLEDLRSRTRNREAVAARRKCYAFLRRKKWTVSDIGEYFLRSDRAIWQGLQDDGVTERKRDYHKQYHERRRAA